MQILERFVAIEGLDGSGTTTQRNLLESRCSEQGITFFSTSEPTDNPIGRLIRSILRGDTVVTPDTLAYLFASDRNEHLYSENTGIVARVRRGEFVFTDRYLFSSLAYQSVESDYSLVFGLNRHFPLPQRVIYIDVPPEIGVERSNGRSYQEIFENIEFQRKVRDGYQKALEWAESEGVTVFRYDGRQPADAIGEKIWTDLAL